MRPKNPVRCETAEKFAKDFDKRFGGKRILKTAFHFFHWVSGREEYLRESMLAEFGKYCKRTKTRASWRNAAEWWEQGRVAK